MLLCLYSSLPISFVKLHKDLRGCHRVQFQKLMNKLNLIAPGKAKAIPHRSHVWEIYPCTEVLISCRKKLLLPKCIKNYLQIVKLAFQIGERILNCWIGKP